MNNSSIARTLTGLGIITAGTVALLGSFGILNSWEIATTVWPIAVIGAGLIMLIANPKNYLWALIILVAGVGLLLRALGFIEFNVLSLFWPVVILFVGFSVLFRHTPMSSTDTSNKGSDDMTAIMSGVSTINTSDDYKGGKAVAIMGGVSLDLTRATIKKQATLDVTSFWGGVEVKVPEGWDVQSKVNVIMGGVEIKAHSANKKNAPVLLVVGDVVMAGVEIKHA